MRFLLNLLITLCALVGCGAPEPTQQSIAPDPAMSDVVVLQVGVSVNAPDPVAVSLSGPRLTLFGDGRVEFHDRNSEAPLTGTLPFSQLQLDADAMAELVDHATAVLRRPIDDDTDIGDADTAWLDIEGERHRIDWRSSRSLLDVEALVGAQANPREPATFERVIVFGVERRGIGQSGLDPFPIDVDITSEYDSRVLPVWCTEVDGDELDLLVGSSNVGPHGFANWLIDGRAQTIGIRPLFSGESGCDVVESL